MTARELLKLVTTLNRYIGFQRIINSHFHYNSTTTTVLVNTTMAYGYRKGRKGYKRSYKRRGYSRNITPAGKVIAIKRVEMLSQRADQSVAGFTWADRLGIPMANSPSPGHTAYGLDFKLSRLPQYTEFTALFDAYKITGVKLRIVPRYSNSDLITLEGNAFMPKPMYITADQDDITVGASWTEVDAMQNEATKIIPIISNNGSPITMYLKVKPQTVLQTNPGTGLSTATAGQFSGWIDTIQPDVLHYGLKLLVPTKAQVDSKNRCEFDIFATYYLKFRNVK